MTKEKKKENEIKKEKETKLITSKELMEALNLSRTTLWRYEKEGLPFVKVLKSKRYDVKKVEKWIENKEGFQIPTGYMSSEEVQEMFSVSRTTLHRMIKKGFPCHKYSNRNIYLKDEINEWVKENENNKN